ncbi:MAG: hypothetical protein SGPRY_003633, partial [Prymnesium sp.]
RQPHMRAHHQPGRRARVAACFEQEARHGHQLGEDGAAGGGTGRLPECACHVEALIRKDDEHHHGSSGVQRYGKI